MNRQIISIQTDPLTLSAFDEAISQTSWLESLHGEGKRSERIRRALAATEKLVEASPSEVKDVLIRDAEDLKRELESLTIGELVNALTRITLLLVLLSALRELERGAHGGDVPEILAHSLRDRVLELEAAKDSPEESQRLKIGSETLLNTIILTLK
ncbi:MAG: hypothetical protein RMJ28_07065 [Nitrososphaerota archaeon]|nr:hypothetical protein [Candidatus Calditenuaceae archaeon]MDW8073974.1 hypothetical protein [Nitrososphaerota archaeon]